MTKQEAIIKAYCEYWDQVKEYVDENGLLHYNNMYDETGWLGDCIQMERIGDSYRPTSLQGIETNNGWIKIEGEVDLPKEDGNYYVILKLHPYIIREKRFVMPIDNWEKDLIIETYSHYKIITIPKPPIY